MTFIFSAEIIRLQRNRTSYERVWKEDGLAKNPKYIELVVIPWFDCLDHLKGPRKPF
jgi:hypothetical protein